MTPLSEQKKALAGAVVGFVGAASNYLLAGGNVTDLVDAGIVLAQSGSSALITYFVVFWLANKPATPAGR